MLETSSLNRTILIKLHSYQAHGNALAGFSCGLLFWPQLKDGGLKPVPINNHEWVMCWKFFFRNIAYSLRKWNSLKLLNLVSQSPGPGAGPLETWSPSIYLWDTRSCNLFLTLSKDFMLLTRTMAHVPWQASATQAYPQPWCSYISLDPAMVQSPLPMKTSIPVPPTPLWLILLFYPPWMMCFPTLSSNGNNPLEYIDRSPFYIPISSDSSQNLSTSCLE